MKSNNSNTYPEVKHLVPDRVERVPLYHFGLVAVAVNRQSDHIQLHNGASIECWRAHVLTGNHLSKKKKPKHLTNNDIYTMKKMSNC